MYYIFSNFAMGDIKSFSTSPTETAMINEYAAEKSESAKEHEREIQRVRKEHKKELDALLRRFSNAAADMERLKAIEAQMKVGI